MTQQKDLWPLARNETPTLTLQQKDPNMVWSDFLKGDQTAISCIYRTYARSLYNYGRQYNHHEIVLDCIQDLFYDLIRSRKQLSQVDSLKAYLFASLRRKILRQARKTKRELDQSDVEDQSAFKIAYLEDGTPEEIQAEKENRKIIQDACNQLPSRQREAILLYFFEELSYKEICQIMNFAEVKHVRTLIHRALSNLRKKLNVINLEI